MRNGWMRRAVFPALAFLWSSPTLAAPVQTEAEAREECSGSAFGQAGMRDCLDAKGRATAADLQRAEIAMISALPSVDIWPRFIAEAKSRFAQSNAAFARYRAAQCAFNASMAGGAAGNSREIMRLACVAELNARRASEIGTSAASLAARIQEPVTKQKTSQPNWEDFYGKMRPGEIPWDVRKLVLDAQICHHFSGEEPYDAKRATELKTLIAEHCPNLDARRSEMLQTHAGNHDVIDLLAEIWKDLE
jgi:Lysozyme inhibitor LprI